MDNIKIKHIYVFKYNMCSTFFLHHCLLLPLYCYC